MNHFIFFGYFSYRKDEKLNPIGILIGNKTTLKINP